MPNELEATRNALSSSLSGALNNAASIITKDYLSRLESCEIIPPSTEGSRPTLADYCFSALCSIPRATKRS